MIDRFPSTHLTWMGARLAAGDEGLADVRRQVMERYAGPLIAYVQGSTLRDLGEPHEIVHGFFAENVCREGYFEQWQASGAKLRRWLMNGLLLHGRGLRRDRQRSREAALVPDDEGSLAVEVDAERAFERSWAERLLSEACDRAREQLAVAGRGRQFELFRRHILDGRGCVDVAAELGFRADECSAIMRAVRKSVRDALSELLQQDGIAAHEVDDEVRHLREILKNV